MLSKTFTIKGADIEAPLTAFIQHYYQTVHESIYHGGFIRMFEDYSLANDNDLAICLRADTTKVSDGIYIVEMIVAGADGGFSADFGFEGNSEHRRIQNFSERLMEFCKAKDFEMEATMPG